MDDKNDKLYSVGVSSLEIRKKPSEKSNTTLKLNTIVKNIGNTRQYKKQEWIEVETISSVIVKGYVQKKYLNPI